MFLDFRGNVRSLESMRREHTALLSRKRPRAQPHNPRGPLYGSSAAFRLDAVTAIRSRSRSRRSNQPARAVRCPFPALISAPHTARQSAAAVPRSDSRSLLRSAARRNPDAMVLGPISPARRAALGPEGAAWDEHQDLSHNMTSVALRLDGNTAAAGVDVPALQMSLAIAASADSPSTVTLMIPGGPQLPTVPREQRRMQSALVSASQLTPAKVLMHRAGASSSPAATSPCSSVWSPDCEHPYSASMAAPPSPGQPDDESVDDKPLDMLEQRRGSAGSFQPSYDTDGWPMQDAQHLSPAHELGQSPHIFSPERSRGDLEEPLYDKSSWRRYSWRRPLLCLCSYSLTDRQQY